MKNVLLFLFLMLVSVSASAGETNMWTNDSHRPKNWALPQLGTADQYEHVGNWNKKTRSFRLTDNLSIKKVKDLPYEGVGLQINIGKRDALWIGSLRAPETGHKAPGLMWEHRF